MAKGDTVKGIEYTMRMWKADPTNQAIAKSIIAALAASGSPEIAVPIIDTMLVQSPGDPEMLSTKWKILLKAASAGNPKLWKPAIAAGEELVKADTAAATLDYFQRQIGAAQNDNDAAKTQELAAKAVQKFPKEISFELLLAQLYLKAGPVAAGHGRGAQGDGCRSEEHDRGAVGDDGGEQHEPARHRDGDRAESDRRAARARIRSGRYCSANAIPAFKKAAGLEGARRLGDVAQGRADGRRRRAVAAEQVLHRRVRRSASRPTR